jgi:uncharacterized protein
MIPDQSFLNELVDRAASAEIVDAHQHLGGWSPVGGTWSPFDDVDTDIATRLAILDKYGVDGCSIMPATQRPGGSAAATIANDVVMNERQRSARFKFALFTITFDSVDSGNQEIDRCVQLGMDGLVLHHRYEGRAVDHPAMWPLMENIAHHGVPVFIHMVPEASSEALWRLERLAGEFPAIQFVALDALSTPANVNWVMYAAGRMPNVAFDTGLLLPQLDVIRSFSTKIGADRLLYGSDLLVMPPSEHFPGPLFEILAAPITNEQRGKILGGNINRIMGCS